MSDHDLELYQPGGEVGPYSPSQPLAPTADNWGNVPDYLTPGEIDSYQKSGSQVQLFGEALPAGATEQQINQVLTEIAALVAGDLMRLGHPQAYITAALNWFQTTAKKTPQREPKRHSYNLGNEAGDLVAESFGNAMARAGADQKFISSCLGLMGELSRRLDAQQVVSHEPRTATPSAGDPLDQLNDQQYAAVIAHNEQVKVQTETVLRRKWATSYDLNVQVAQQYLENLPANERAHFDQFTGNWVHMLNTVEALTFLFDSAIGRASIPTSGGAVASEIAQIENLMQTNRRAYNSDNQIQARLRTLYDIRDRGR